MVGIGILSSLVFITKPVWWDRYVDHKIAMAIQHNIYNTCFIYRIIVKCWQYCEQK